MTRKKKRALTVQNAPSSFFSAYRTSSGITVTPRASLTASPVWQALTLITGGVSQIPFLTYRPAPGGVGVTEAKDHAVHPLIARHTGEYTADVWKN